MASSTSPIPVNRPLAEEWSDNDLYVLLVLFINSQFYLFQILCVQHLPNNCVDVSLPVDSNNWH